jgi:iron complex transport system ATP-binding protein
VNAGYQLHNVGMAYNGKPVLDSVSLAFTTPELVAIVGPNGAGKSTLLNVMAGLRPGFTGQCLYHGRDVRRWSRREFARRVSFVPQSLALLFPFNVEQVVMQGRTPYGDGLFETAEDHAAVDEALAITETSEFRHRDFRSLSGGERQRVVIASAIAQQPRTLLLDEPTTFLDLKHQVQIYRLLADLASRGILVITITHDLNLAAAYASRIIVLHHGRLRADAQPREVLSESVVSDVFGIDLEVHRGHDGRPWILYGDPGSHS